MAPVATATVRNVFLLFSGVVLLTTVYIIVTNSRAPLQITTTYHWAVHGRQFLSQRQLKSVSKEEINVRDPSNGAQGYLMARLYQQQMTADTINFFELSTIAARLNLSIVEPFVQGTHFVGIPDMTPLHEDHKFWELSKFYDLHHLQAALKNCSSLHQLVSFDNLLTESPHNIVLVYFLTTRDYNDFKEYFPGENYPSIVELKLKESARITQVNQTLTILNTCMNHFAMLQWKQLPFFHHPRVVLVDARPFNPLLLSVLTDILGSIVSEEINRYGSVMLIFDQWRGHHKKNETDYFYYMPDFRLDLPACGGHIIRHSEAVIEATLDFSLTLNQTRPVIGVHIRGERLLQNTKGNFSHCIHQLTTLLQTLTNASKIPSERVNVFHDLGNFGTKSCTYGYCVRGRSKLLSQINTLGYPVIFYDPTKFNSVPDSPAFASFVEQEYLAHVDILVTLGGGGFQRNIVRRFVNNSDHNVKHLYRIC